MANKIQIRRGLKAHLPTLSAGEPAFPTDTREFFIGTGSGNVNMGGSHWYRGTAMSGTSTTTGAYSYSACPEVKLDDIYMNTSNGNIYACTTAGKGTTAKWTYQGCIKGPQGAKGTTGATGAAGQDKQAVYSTAPTQIGTWIDGKAIYRVAWSFTIAEYKAAGVIYGINDLPHYPSSISGKGVVREHYNIAAWSIPEGFSYTNVPDLQSGISANSSIPTTTVVYCVLEYIAS